MNTKSKVIIIICSVFAVAFLALYIVLGFFKPVVVEELYYPSGGLSQSVFESQNMTYLQTNGYSNKHSFWNVPYTIDTVSGKRAGIGNGAFYQSEPYYFYYSELPVGGDMVETIKKEMTDILSITANESDTTVQVLSEGSGYINGCSATFYVLSVAAGQVNSSVCVYRMHISDGIYKSDYDLLVGVLDKNLAVTTETLNNLYTLVSKSVYTMQYNKELHESITKRMENAAVEETVVEPGPESTPAPTAEPEPTAVPENDLFKTP